MKHPLSAGQQLAQELAENVTDERLAVAIFEAHTATQINRDGTQEVFVPIERSIC